MMISRPSANQEEELRHLVRHIQLSDGAPNASKVVIASTIPFSKQF